MYINIVHRSQSLATYCHDMYLAVGERAQLGIIYKSAPLAAPHESGMYLALIDIEQQRCDSLVVYSDTGPGPRSGKYAVSDVLLRYDAARKRWVIAQLHNGHYIALRTLTTEAPGKLALSPLCLLDREDDFERGFNPLLDLQINEKTYRVLTHKAVHGHLSAPQVRELDVALGGNAWSALKEPFALVASGGDILPLPPHDEEVVLPEESYFDPYLSDISWNSAALLAKNDELATSENAMISTSSSVQLLALASPEHWVSAKGLELPLATSDQEQWRVWITAWNSHWTTQRWSYTSQIGLPVEDALPAYEYPAWPVINVVMSNGPEQQGETVVAIVCMQDEEHKRILSECVCLKQNTGEILQICSSPFGLTPSLCRCGEMMVGVDLFEGQWRLWNWPALQQSAIFQNKLLSPTCASAYVYAMPENDGQFWLIEDRDEGIAVSQYNAKTLDQLSSAVLLPELHLLYTQHEERPLNGYRSPGLIAYRDSFFLLLRGVNDEMILYQAR